MNISIALEVLWRLHRWRQRDRWTRQQLEAHQARAIRALREHAYARSPFYRRFHRGLVDRPLHELPVLTKAVLMEHFDELVTDPAVHLSEVEEHLATLRGDERFLGRHWVNATSGTTGRRGLFLFDRAEWVTILTGFARAHAWAGVKVSLTHRMRMASVTSTAPWHMSARMGAALDSRWMPALRLDAGEPVGLIVERLNAWRPDMLVTYPSVARVLADEQLAGSLHIAPHLIFTSAEVLSDETRRGVEEVWDKHLFNEYAATEAGVLAAECDRHAGLHLYEDLVIAEVVDERNRPVPPGVYGDKVLISVLFGRTQPLIRYEISDTLRLSPSPCPCGRAYALIDDIRGRAEEVLHLPAPDGDRVAVHPNVFHRVMDALPGSGWQIIHEPAGLTILLEGTHGGKEDKQVADRLRRELADRGVAPLPVAVRRVDSVPRGATGKAPLIKSNLPHTAPSTTGAENANRSTDQSPS